MNMQTSNMQTSNTQYNFFSPRHDRFAASHQAAITKLVDFAEFLKKFKLTEKIELVRKRGFLPSG